MRTVLKIINTPGETSDPSLAILLANLAGLVAQVETVIKRFTIINRDDSEHRQWIAKFSAEPQPHFDCSIERNPSKSRVGNGILGVHITCTTFSVDKNWMIDEVLGAYVPCVSCSVDRLARYIVETLYPDFWPWGSTGDLESMFAAA